LHHENKIVNSSNVSKFYRYANKNFSVKSTIGPLKGPSGDLIIDPYSKAELLSNTSDSFTINNHYCPQLPKLVPDDTATGISSIVFTPSLVHKSINHLRAESAGGPDRIPPLFFKKCSLWLCQPLSYLFQSCFNAGFMPPEWSQAHIAPIFKKGNPTDPLSYRPIALTCTMCKLMELILKDQSLSYLSGKHLISRHQHAFIIKHSTTTNLLESLRDWSIALNKSNLVDVTYIDFRHEFDSIVFTKLLYKLQCYGVSVRLLAWLSAFVTGRSQCVVVENFHSSYVDIINGVP
jgi:Reverse transcriptase (RNA-dependent DNA polymerase)